MPYVVNEPPLKDASAAGFITSSNIALGIPSTSTVPSSNRIQLAMLRAVEMSAPGPAMSSACASIVTQRGISRPKLVHDSLKRPVFKAVLGKYVLDDMLSGARMREDTKDVKDELV
jgi:hypothetical protein